MGGLGASLAGSLAACNVSFDPNEEVGSQEEADTAWPDGTYARFRDNGFLYSTHPYTDLSYMHVIAAAAGSNWAAANPHRFGVILKAMNEVHAGLCGDAARERYNAKNNWCSEFTRWLYLQAGAKNLSYCALPGLQGECYAWQSLANVRLTAQMVQLFAHYNAYVPDAYVPAERITKTSVRPGDYLSLVGSQGANSHSAIVLGVSANYKYLWTAEGNVGDCMDGSIHPFIQDGVLDSRICGVGNMDIFF